MLALNPRKVAIAAIFLALLCVYVSAGKSGPPAKSSGPKSQITRLFDFSHYRKMFSKRYSDVTEELVRKKLFLAKAFRALVSAISYKFKKSTYFLALNQMSDRTKKEMEATHLSPQSLDDIGTNYPVKAAKEESDLLVESMAEIDVGVRNLKDLAAENHEDRIVDELNRLQGLGSVRRQKRSTDDIREDFSFEQIYDRSMKVKQSPGTRYKAEDESLEIVGSGFKMGRQFKKTMTNILGMDSKSSKSRRYQILDGISDPPTSWNRNYRNRYTNSYSSSNNKVYIDHSKKDCMYAPSHQRFCGSCYAFAVAGYYEWLYCKVNGQLIPFSEQFVVDCGPVFLGHAIFGCSGGHLVTTAQFFQNHGAELSTRYPYKARQGSCPYSNKRDTTGFLSFDNTAAMYASIPVSRFPEHLEYGPMVVTIFTDGDFMEYGGGVHAARYCYTSRHGNPHAVILIGHGNEDGQEYWLIRNSYSKAWGANGYYKISKNADCFRGRSGLMFGTRDGKKFQLKARAKGPIPPF